MEFTGEQGTLTKVSVQAARQGFSQLWQPNVSNHVGVLQYIPRKRFGKLCHSFPSLPW